MSDFLAGAGVLLAALASAAPILLPPGRTRSAAMLAAIALSPVLILGDQWHTAQIVDLRDHASRIVALAVVAALALAALAYLFSRWPRLLPLAIVFALPFRVPLHAGGDTANLLVPLYLVIAGGVVSLFASTGGWRGDGVLARTPEDESPISPTGPAARAAAWLPRILAAFVVLYALQTWYSDDFSKGLQNACFFLVPFTVAYGLLQGVEWDRKLLRWTLVMVGAEAAVFVLIGTVEASTRNLFWNDQIIRVNEFHTYFRVNSVFWDPNIYGRYLALVTVVATAALLWARTRQAFWLLCGLILVLWIGLVPTYSQSSFIALLAGLAVLAAIKWSWRWTLLAVAIGALGAVVVVVFVGGSGNVSLNRIGNVDLSGRGNLVSGGLELFSERPVWGYGSGSFQHAYRDHQANKDVAVSVSHTEPVTVAAEQGLIGLTAYLALLVVALWTLGSGLFPRGPTGGWRGDGVLARTPEDESPISPTGPAARAAVFATFVALLVHTMAYAGFFEDPITWVLLAVGASLATAPAVRDPA